MKYILKNIICASVFFAGSITVNAATATGEFDVTITITDECRVKSTNTLNFGSNGQIAANISASTTFVVNCTGGTPYNIGLNAGTTPNSTVATRLMKHTTASDTISYSLYTTSAHTTVWGNTVSTDTVPRTAITGDETLTIYGMVPAQSVTKTGAYSDRVTITLTY